MKQIKIKGKSLLGLIKDPTLLKGIDASTLSDLATKYPYNEHIHLVRLLQDFQLHGQVDKSLLAAASTTSSDRKKLAQWIYDLTSTGTKATVNIEPVDGDMEQDILTRSESEVGTAVSDEKGEPMETPGTTDRKIRQKTKKKTLMKTWIREDSGTAPKAKTKKAKKKKKQSSISSSLRKKKAKKKTRLTKVIDDVKANGNDPFELGETNDFLIWLKKLEQIRSVEPTTKKQKSRAKKKKAKKGQAKDGFGGKSSIISETLAELLAQQGRPSKAIAMYNELSLKYPEKSAFFALKIKDLQEKTD